MAHEVSGYAEAAKRFGPVGWEPHPWMPGYDVSLLSRRQQAAMPSTYQAAVPVDIAPLDFAVNGAVAADAEDAAAAIVRLDTYVSSVFGEDDIAPMRSVLLRSESAASSQIENLTVGARQLALVELGATASHNAKLVAQNVAAMDAAVRLSERLDAEAILSMHKVLLRDRPDQAGRWREQQVWIGASGVSPAGAAFVPPHHDRVPAAIADLVQFLARNDLPVLVHAAIAHAQFETIHPFVDGNGRTGRALLHAHLRNKQLVRRVTIPVSAGLLADTNAYFKALTAYRQGDIEPIVSQLAAASIRAAGLGRWLVDQLADVRDGWLKRLPSRTGSAGRRLASILVGQPAVNVTFVVERLGVSATAARRAIDQATAAGLLVETSDRKRNRVWIAREALAVFDEFSDRAGRRV